ncbi:hypothetical protein AA313_de0203634 [Arthrobotrys entomopaga]|nr:hypothetical protein AA313_de0203634 [Arthrobotrys entomopaga]
MMFLHTMLALAATLLLLPTQIHAATKYRGFSMGANTKTGACKSTADWEADFRAIKSWGKGFNCIRLYASSDCGTLANAVPAAQAVGFKLLVGVWATDSNHFGAEKAALLSAIQRFGTAWIAGVSVGSEDLYRKDISAQNLANQIYDVRGMVRQFNNNIQVGHTDTWTAWVDPANDVATNACDMVIINGFPYWQGVPIRDAIKQKTFQNSVWDTKRHIQAFKPNMPFWVGETGWPTQGDHFGGAAPAKTNAYNYYNNAACWMFGNINLVGAFYFTPFDTPTSSGDHGGVEKFFGVADSNRKLKFTLPC